MRTVRLLARKAFSYAGENRAAGEIFECPIPVSLILRSKKLATVAKYDTKPVEPEYEPGPDPALAVFGDPQPEVAAHQQPEPELGPAPEPVSEPEAPDYVIQDFPRDPPATDFERDEDRVEEPITIPTRRRGRFAKSSE